VAARAAVENVGTLIGAHSPAEDSSISTDHGYAVTSAIAHGSSRTARSARSREWLAGYSGTTNAGSACSCRWWNVIIVDHADDVAGAVTLVLVTVSGRTCNDRASGKVNAIRDAC
jgi:hypothetical protein